MRRFAITMTTIVVCGLVLMSGFVLAGDGVVLYDFDQEEDHFEWGSFSAQANVSYDYVESVLPDGTTGSVLQVKTHGGAPDSWAELGTDRKPIPKSSSVFVWVKLVAGEGKVNLFFDEIFLSKIFTIKGIYMQELADLVKRQGVDPGIERDWEPCFPVTYSSLENGVLVEGGENGWYKVTFNTSSIDCFSEWSPNGRVDWPMKLVWFHWWAPKDLVMQIAQVGYNPEK